MNDNDVRTPESLRLVRDFVNSVEFQIGKDDFRTPGQLADWLAHRGLLDPSASLSAADLDTAKTVREGLRSVLHLHAGHEADLLAIDRMNAALGATTASFGFDHSGATRIDVTGGGHLTATIDSLVKAIASAEHDGTWERLKVCSRDSCQWAFYDASKNRSGRWCSMAGCGNYVKMRRVAERRAASTAG